MARYKFSIGQSVKVAMEDRWVGDYDAPGTIISFGNVFYNGVPTYNVKINDQEILQEISEKQIKT